MPFLRAASQRASVTLLAQPHAAPLLARFAPAVQHLPLTVPWTRFSGKYRLVDWPWRALFAAGRRLRAERFPLGVSARRDPRDHLLLTLAGVSRRLGFPRAGSAFMLTDRLPAPPRPHRAAHWEAVAQHLGWPLSTHENPPLRPPPATRRIAIHTGAGHPVRRWPVTRYADLAARLRTLGWEVRLIDDSLADLPALLELLASADRFIGNDSGPGHLAALLGVPTFTIFGPQLPALFAPQHPQAAWIEGAACPHKPCFDACRFPRPHCIETVSLDAVWPRVQAWLALPTSDGAP